MIKYNTLKYNTKYLTIRRFSANSSPKHLNEDGTLKEYSSSNHLHWTPTPGTLNTIDHTEIKIIDANNQKQFNSFETKKNFQSIFKIIQNFLPIYKRERTRLWTNQKLAVKSEYLFFWIPTFIIWSIAIPSFAGIYMLDEAVYTTMTIKAIGRQWYWVYEIESPTET